jgi:hypothetical protein
MGAEELSNALRGTDEVQLTVTGRTSARESSRPVWFVHEGETLYLLPVSGSDSNWYKNLLTTSAIGLAAGGTEFSARAIPIDDDAKVREVVDKFRAKYGADQVESYYPKQDVAVEVPLTA